jgi:hypothetical protein
MHLHPQLKVMVNGRRKKLVDMSEQELSESSDINDAYIFIKLIKHWAVSIKVTNCFYLQCWSVYFILYD